MCEIGDGKWQISDDVKLNSEMKNGVFGRIERAKTRVLGIPSLGGLEVSEVLPHLVPYVLAVSLRYGSPENGENLQIDPGINLRNLQTSTPLVFGKRVALGLRLATLDHNPATRAATS